MLQQSITRIGARAALFLDVDGTLLEIAATPLDVHVPEGLPPLLNTLRQRFDGALALVSGRGIQSIDALFAPYRFCAAGIHGLERRSAQGQVHVHEVDREGLERARAVLSEFVARHPGLILEDKTLAVALHYRMRPELHTQAEAQATAALQLAGAKFALLRGKCVLELRPQAATKGSAIASFMREAPFVGRHAVFVGDDVTDEDGFMVVNELGGLSVRVGTHGVTLARERLASVAEVLETLRTWCDSLRAPLLNEPIVGTPR